MDPIGGGAGVGDELSDRDIFNKKYHMKKTCPDAQCMIYLPTFTPKLPIFVNLGLTRLSTSSIAVVPGTPRGIPSISVGHHKNRAGVYYLQQTLKTFKTTSHSYHEICNIINFAGALRNPAISRTNPAEICLLDGLSSSKPSCPN